MERKVKRAAIVSRSTAAEEGRERKERERECVCVYDKVGKTRRKSTAEALLTFCSRCCAQAL